MLLATQTQLISGPVGAIELAIDFPPSMVAWQGIALVAHPHPLFGGSLDNKVAQTLARAFAQLGYLCVRPNFRGVGKSEGQHDNGIGEQEDMLAVLAWMRQPSTWIAMRRSQSNGGTSQGVMSLLDQDVHFVSTCPLILGGFSFGSYVLSHVAAFLTVHNTPAQRLVLVGTPTSRWEIAQVPHDSLLIHGEKDDTIPLTSVFEWAGPQDLPIIVVPGADHFFHRKLHIIKRVILSAWHLPA